MMVVWASGYYGFPFNGYRGVTQGNHIITKLFNVAVDKIIRYCMNIMKEEVTGLEGFDCTLQQMDSFLIHRQWSH